MVGIRHDAFSFVPKFELSFVFPSIKLQMQKVPIVMFVAKWSSIPQHGSEKTLIGHYRMWTVFQILLEKGSRLGIGQIVREFLANDKPLAGRVKIGTMGLFGNRGQTIDAMEAVIALDKIVPNVWIWTVGFQNNV